MTLFSMVSLPFIGLFPSVARLYYGLEPTGSTYKWLYVIVGRRRLLRCARRGVVARPVSTSGG